MRVNGACISPNPAYPVSIECSVCAYDGYAQYKCLRNQHAVERIAMMQRQHASLDCMLQTDRQLRKTLLSKSAVQT